jgi:tRNA-splicing ligase RtcB (3'-phosphate/5'-hydroxy nucleic acid ligase)
MSDPSLPQIRMWLTAPLGHEVAEALGRLQRAPDVQQIAVMPDVHLANDICVGVVLATSRLIYPQAVGGDIGCGMLAVATNSTAEPLRDPKAAGQILAGFAKAIPSRRRNRQAVIAQPQELDSVELSNVRLESIRQSEGTLEFATLGSGNHFLELQADEEDRLWLMIHSGSRALGQAIRDHHLADTQIVDGRFRALDAESEQGAAYLHDLDWARRFAAASRRAMAAEAEKVIQDAIGIRLLWKTSITTDHNHVALELHGAGKFWVHRKGAMVLQAGELGVLPGSMGTLSFHVEGRGCEEALNSSAHGAGRAMSRSEAARKVSRAELQRQMKGVWFDWRLADAIRDEAPSAYKDIRAVLKDQHDLVKVRRTLRPLLNYKGT